MIDKRVEDWCVQAMTVQEFKPRSNAGDQQQHSGDILSPEDLENEKESSHSYRIADQQQDSENLLGRVLAGKTNIYFSLATSLKSSRHLNIFDYPKWMFLLFM